MNKAGGLSQKQLQFEFKNNECLHGKNKAIRHWCEAIRLGSNKAK